MDLLGLIETSKMFRDGPSLHERTPPCCRSGGVDQIREQEVSAVALQDKIRRINGRNKLPGTETMLCQSSGDYTSCQIRRHQIKSEHIL